MVKSSAHCSSDLANIFVRVSSLFVANFRNVVYGQISEAKEESHRWDVRARKARIRYTSAPD